MLLGAGVLALCRPAGAQSSPESRCSEARGYWHDEWSRFPAFEAMLSAAVTARNETLGKLDGPTSAGGRKV